MRSMNRFLKSIPALLALTGCIFTTDEKVAGGAQDFPNTLTLGAAASTHVGDNADWDQFSAIPDRLPAFADADSMFVAPETLSAKPKQGALAKTAAAADTVFWDLADTATLKVARRISQSENLVRIKGDTLVYRYDEKAKDSVLGNEILLESKGAVLIKATERREAYRYENPDSAGGFDRAIFQERLPALLPAGFKHRLLILLPGPDGDFAARADNRPAYYAFGRTRTLAAGIDTLEAFEIVDVDGDGALWGAGDSGVVDFRQRIPTPPGRPMVELAVLRMRAILFKEEARTYPISYRETRTEKDGKQIAFSVRGERGGADSTFRAGDTAWITVHVDFPDGARMVEKTARYKVLLAGEPKLYAGNRLLRYSLEATWHKGDSLASTKFTFAPDRPLSPGDLAVAGALTLNADLANGASAVAEGTFKDKVIDAVVTHTGKDGRKRRYQARWSHLGALLQQTRLD